MFRSKRFQYVINYFHYRQELWGEIVLVKKNIKGFSARKSALESYSF